MLLESHESHDSHDSHDLKRFRKEKKRKKQINNLEKNRQLIAIVDFDNENQIEDESFGASYSKQLIISAKSDQMLNNASPKSDAKAGNTICICQASINFSLLICSVYHFLRD